MFIETEGTPNPATLKFLPGQDVMGLTTADFASAASAERSPLATALFALPGVARVFLGGDFVTVTKSDQTTWADLKPLVLGAIMEHFVTGRPVMNAGAYEEMFEEDVDPADREIVDRPGNSRRLRHVRHLRRGSPAAGQQRDDARGQHRERAEATDCCGELHERRSPQFLQKRASVSFGVEHFGHDRSVMVEALPSPVLPRRFRRSASIFGR